MKKRTEDKDVQQILGMPMRWNRKKMFNNIWNKDDDRIFPPKQFGIGWSLNFHALCKEVGLIQRRRNKN